MTPFPGPWEASSTAQAPLDDRSAGDRSAVRVVRPAPAPAHLPAPNSIHLEFGLNSCWSGSRIRTSDFLVAGSRSGKTAASPPVLRSMRVAARGLIDPHRCSLAD